MADDELARMLGEYKHEDCATCGTKGASEVAPRPAEDERERIAVPRSTLDEWFALMVRAADHTVNPIAGQLMYASGEVGYWKQQSLAAHVGQREDNPSPCHLCDAAELREGSPSDLIGPDRVKRLCGLSHAEAAEVAAQIERREAHVSELRRAVIGFGEEINRLRAAAAATRAGADTDQPSDQPSDSTGYAYGAKRVHVGDPVQYRLTILSPWRDATLAGVGETGAVVRDNESGETFPLGNRVRLPGEDGPFDMIEPSDVDYAALRAAGDELAAAAHKLAAEWTTEEQTCDQEQHVLRAVQAWRSATQTGGAEQ